MSVQNALSRTPEPAAGRDDDVAFLSAVELVAHYGAKTLSPVDVTRAILDRIQRLDSRVNAFALLDADAALVGGGIGRALVAR